MHDSQADEISGLVPEQVIIVDPLVPAKQWLEQKLTTNPGGNITLWPEFPVCLDGRTMTTEDTLKWIKDFNSAIQAANKEAVIDLTLVIVNNQGLPTECTDAFVDERILIDWIQTTDLSTDVLNLYQASCREQISQMVNSDNLDLDQSEDPNARPLEEFMSAQEAAELRERMRLYNEGQSEAL